MSENRGLPDGNGKQCEIDCACSIGECPHYDWENHRPRQRRRDDSQPGQPVQMRDGLSAAVYEISKSGALSYEQRMTLELAAQTLSRDEEENARMIGELVHRGYKDVPPRINFNLIRRLLGYITPI